MTTFTLDPATDVVASVPRSSRPYQRRQYRDKKFLGGEQEWNKKLDESSTVYVGNLSCYTNEYQLYELFSRCGSIKKIIMGLHNVKKTPCGFCFVEYDDKLSARKSIKYLNRSHLDGRDIHVDLDAGFQEGRQFGRGSTGGQIGDERRRESGGGAYRGGANLGSGAMLTRSITIVACLTMISFLLLVQRPVEVESAEANMNLRTVMPFGFLGGGLYNPFMFPYMNPHHGRGGSSYGMSKASHAQMMKQKKQFETDLALFLVNLMKSSKPTLLKAFIKATLADKQLKETAIGLFFGGSEEEDSTDSDKDKEKEKDDDDEDEKDHKEKGGGNKERVKDKKKRSERDKGTTTAAP